jgi:hypothetical protein
VQTTGGAGGSGRAAWQLFGTPARRGGARNGQRGHCGRWEEGWIDAWSKWQRGGVQREKNREKLGFGKDEGDLVVKSRKLRGLTVKYR